MSNSIKEETIKDLYMEAGSRVPYMEPSFQCIGGSIPKTKYSQSKIEAAMERLGCSFQPAEFQVQNLPWDEKA